MNRIFSQALCHAVVLLSSVAAFASEHGAPAEHGGGATTDHTPHIANVWGLGSEHAQAPALGWLSITFVVFVSILVFVLKKPLTIYLENRSDAVMKAIEEARRAKEAAEQKAKEAEAKLAALDANMKNLRAEFESQGKAESERMEKLAKETAARIQKDAEDTINAERERAKMALQAEAVRLALQLAEERIKGAVNTNDDARLQKQLIADLAQ